MMTETSACSVTKQHQRIDSIEKFIHWTPEIKRFIEALPKGDDTHTAEQILDAIARQLFNPEFSFWILQHYTFLRWPLQSLHRNRFVTVESTVADLAEQ